MHLSYLTDEMLDDLPQALALGKAWGLHQAEMRSVNGINILDMDDALIRRAKQILDDHGMTVSAVATPFFKCILPGRSAEEAGPMHNAQERSYAEHLALLPRGVEVAQAFGAPAMRIFSFWRTDRDAAFWEEMNRAVDAAVDAARAAGITVCLENEGACCIGTSAELAEAAQKLTNPALRFIWDPGNSTRRGMPPRAEDFGQFADRIALVHLKDGTYDATGGKDAAALIGKGQTDYAAELRRIQAAGYDGALTLEPHYCPDGDCVEGMRQSVAAIRRIASGVGIDLGSPTRV